MSPSGAREKLIIAIDGPAGVGKSTAARRVAKSLGFALVDTGALYRSVALAAVEAAVSWDQGAELADLIRTMLIELDTVPSGACRLLIDGRDRSADIRAPNISMGASAVSRHPEVRSALLELQRRLGRQGGVVLEGRDIGTVVFPDAEVKAFLTATPEVRAQRRYDELVGRGGTADYEETLDDVIQRDEQDSSRKVAPLRPAADASIVDTTELSLDQVVARILDLASQTK